MVAIKRIYASITDHVQMVGYREIVEAQGKARGLNGFVFNDVDGSVKIMASGPEHAIVEFIHDLKLNRPDTTIESQEIMEDIRFPSPFGRVVTDDIREISDRMDKGNKILGNIDLNLSKNTDILTENTNILSENTGQLSDINKTLHGIDDKLDMLPERIAKALMR
ncbi:MAG: acylphosphatase [Desulfobacterales bacterium]|nr:acylphosphatase [Desulfobacterales bacterium]